MKKIISATLALLFVFTLIASPALAADSPKKMKIAFCIKNGGWMKITGTGIQCLSHMV